MDNLTDSSVINLIKFLEIVGILKRIKRMGWVEAGIYEPESVADHIFRTTILCMIYADINSINPMKMIRMALIHDIPEAVIGDLTPSQKNKKTKEEEQNAILKIFELLPDKEKEKYFLIWKEYQNGLTKEAKAVRQIDKIEMALQAKEYEKLGLTKSKLDRFIKSAKDNISWSEFKKFLLFIEEEKN